MTPMLYRLALGSLPRAGPGPAGRGDPPPPPPPELPLPPPLALKRFPGAPDPPSPGVRESPLCCGVGGLCGSNKTERFEALCPLGCW